MVNSGIRRLDSPLDHIDRTAKAIFVPTPKPRTYSFDLSAYRESVRRLTPSESAPSHPGSKVPTLPSFKPLKSKPLKSPSASSRLSTSSPSRSSQLPPNLEPSFQPLPTDYSSTSSPLGLSPNARHDELFNLPQVYMSQSALQPNLPVPLTAMNLLRDIEATIICWQSALHRVVSQVEALYHEGPMIDGWLESKGYDAYPRQQRGLQVGRQHPPQPHPSPFQSNDAVAAFYYVCGYTESGELWSRPCPPEQVAGVSMAISRYQKLQELLRHKQAIERHLAELAQTILDFHGRVRSIGRRRDR